MMVYQNNGQCLAEDAIPGAITLYLTNIVRLRMARYGSLSKEKIVEVV